jgi:hypothetical protein
MVTDDGNLLAHEIGGEPRQSIVLTLGPTIVEDHVLALIMPVIGTVDAEVAKTLEFRPPLSEFTFATTALNDASLQAHVDAITAEGSSPLEA